MGHLGCIQTLTILNSAAKNMDVQVALLYPGHIPLDVCPRVVSLAFMVNFFSLQSTQLNHFVSAIEKD
jgi:thiamine biosynthesis protein ThiC